MVFAAAGNAIYLVRAGMATTPAATGGEDATECLTRMYLQFIL